MCDLEFESDIRKRKPTETDPRRARFQAGWRQATTGKRYTEKALKKLTWQNLGWRLGKLFGDTSEELMKEMYTWCVRQQPEHPRSESISAGQTAAR